MLEFIVRRSITLIPILWLISIVSFVIIELPPGDWIDVRLATLRDSGIELDDEEADRLEAMYGFDLPVHERYLRWMRGIVFDFNFGWSFQWTRPVNDLLAERLPLTLLISLLSLVVSWLIAIPIGIYSATHQYSTPDYVFTFFGFLGLAIPGFLLALVMAWILFRFFGFSSSGLYDISFVGEPMSWPKFVSILQHLILPLLIIGLAGTGATIRIMRPLLGIPDEISVLDIFLFGPPAQEPYKRWKKSMDEIASQGEFDPAQRLSRDDIREWIKKRRHKVMYRDASRID